MDRSDISRKILSDIITFSKYARFREDLGRRETWDEVVTRNKEMHLRKFPALAGEIEEAYQFVYDKKVFPSMRALQFGGKPVEISPNRQYNCLGRETRFITTDGVKSFNDFNHNDETTVLTHTGEWKPARVHNYGQDVLYKIHLVRGKSKKTVRATANHRWLLQTAKKQLALKMGIFS